MTDEQRQRKREARARWEAKNPEYRRQWRLKNIDKVRERSRKAAQRWRDKYPDRKRRYYQENAALIAEKTKKKKQANPEVFRERSRRYWASPKGRAGYLLMGAKQRCENVTVTKAWIQERLDHGHCEVTGLPFVLTANKIANPWSPSLDQIVPGQGYTPENTQVVVWIYNVAKGSWKHEDVLSMANALLELEGKREAA